MTQRYLMVLGKPSSPLNETKRAMARCGLTVLADQAGLVVFADPGAIRFPLGEGLLLGTIFTRGATTPSGEFELSKQAASIASVGEFLIETCWGDYVALLPHQSGEGWHVLRAPFGALPCLWAKQDGLVWIASDVPLLEQAGLHRPLVDWEALRFHLMQPELRRASTCLAGISDLLGGVRLSVVNDTHSLREVWSPWTFARQREVPPADAATRLRGAINISVAATTARYDQALLLLSGGLDSSVVAASLHGAGRRFSCLTFRSDGARGDESRYARAVADHVGSAWHEARPDPDRVDPARSASANLPRPNERMFYQAYDRIAIELAGKCGAAAILDGGGGDHLFYGHPSVAPIADCLLTSNGRFRSSAAALADLTGSSRWRVMLWAMRRAWCGRTSPVWRNPRYDFLTGAPVAMGLLDPWFDPPPDILPGKGSHVRLLALARTLVECSDPQRLIPNVSVLMTQHLVEACLAMPTDLWFAPGWNRALARSAFRTALPGTVINRRSKGTPDAFVATVFERNRPRLRSILRDGLLAERGLIDRDRVTQMLDSPAPAIGYGFARILELVDAESWARSRS